MEGTRISGSLPWLRVNHLVPRACPGPGEPGSEVPGVFNAQPEWRITGLGLKGLIHLARISFYSERRGTKHSVLASALWTFLFQKDPYSRCSREDQQEAEKEAIWTLGQ